MWLQPDDLRRSEVAPFKQSPRRKARSGAGQFKPSRTSLAKGWVQLKASARGQMEASELTGLLQERQEACTRSATVSPSGSTNTESISASTSSR
jgi:hypothetical protein